LNLPEDFPYTAEDLVKAWSQWTYVCKRGKHPVQDDADISHMYANILQTLDGIFFLAGTYDVTIDSPRKRACAINVDSTVFFPIVNCIASTLEDGKSGKALVEEVRLENKNFSQGESRVIILDEEENVIAEPRIQTLDSGNEPFLLFVDEQSYIYDHKSRRMIPSNRDASTYAACAGRWVCGRFDVEPVSRFRVEFKGVLNEANQFESFQTEVEYRVKIVR
jgi:hypothetical protein